MIPTPAPARWLLLIISLPSNSATARVRNWRALKSVGCAALRDGAYLLPYALASEQQLRELADETMREGGSAWLLAVDPQSNEDEAAYRSLFDRSVEYADLLRAFADARKALGGFTPQEINRVLRKLRREYEALRSIDYFPNDASAQADAAWLDFVNVPGRATCHRRGYPAARHQGLSGTPLGYPAPALGRQGGERMADSSLY
jgi:hypothetical protein